MAYRLAYKQYGYKHYSAKAVPGRSEHSATFSALQVRLERARSSEGGEPVNAPL